MTLPPSVRRLARVLRAGALCVLAMALSRPADAQIIVGYPPPYGGAYYDRSASVRLQVSPKETQVFVDGYYAGAVDEFDGTFQRLRVEPGNHDITLFLPGHRLYTEKLYLQPGNTTKIRHAMERLAAGEAEPERPQPPPRTTQAPPGGPERPQPRRPQPPPPRQEREPRSESRPEPGTQPGTVSLGVQPDDTDVLVDGERRDGPSGSERLLIQLTPGTHQIEVRKSGYRGYLTEVNVRSGETLSVNVALSKE